MKFEETFSIFLGILLGLFMGFTKHELPLPVRIWKSNVKNPRNGTEVIEKHLYNCNEFEDIYIDIIESWKRKTQCLEESDFRKCVLATYEMTS